jgi:hypothetical protein
MFWELASSLPDMLSIFNGQAGKKYPAQKAYRIEEIPSLRHKNTKRIKIIYRLYTLRAANVCLIILAEKLFKLI